jgi:hypothetical protein
MEQRTVGDDLRRLAFTALVALLCSLMALSAGDVEAALLVWALPAAVAIAIIWEWRTR